MSNPTRLLELLRSAPSEMSYADVKTLLDSLGWDIREGKGSHAVVTSPRGNNISVPRKSKRVKKWCLNALLKEINGSGGV